MWFNSVYICCHGFLPGLFTFGKGSDMKTCVSVSQCGFTFGKSRANCGEFVCEFRLTVCIRTAWTYS